jgi:hypothetical protein
LVSGNAIYFYYINSCIDNDELAPVAIALIALVVKLYSSDTHTPFGVNVIPDPLTADVPTPKDILLADKLTKTKPFRLALLANTCPDATPTEAVAGEDPASGVLVLIILLLPAPTPGF